MILLNARKLTLAVGKLKPEMIKYNLLFMTYFINLLAIIR